tara:strand:- start:14315 stop:14515 length:201 start_codon:yes stop_codon:yes gene_type:complete
MDIIQVIKKVTKEIVKFSISKKNYRSKMLYLIKGFFYLLPLILEENKKGKANADDELLGDDIYPLF